MTIEQMPSPILITGCARSGTSMVAGAIKLCGAFGGKLAEPGDVIERGMYENLGVADRIVKPYLQRSSLDPMGQYPLPNSHRLYIPKDWQHRVCTTIQNDSYAGGPWFYKSSRSCLIWPVWHYAFPNAKWIIVRRRTGDIVSSCLKTNFMMAFKHESCCKAIGVKTEQEGWLWWVHQHEKRFVEMIMEGVNCKVVWPHRMVDGDYQEMMETIEWLGLKWNSEVLSFIDPKFWKVRRK